MDSFIDRFAQKRNAQEMIKANYMAEAEENARLSAQVADYEHAVQEIRKVNLQNIENAEKVHEVLELSLKKIAEVQVQMNTPNDTAAQQALLKEMALQVESQKQIIEGLLKSQKASIEDLLSGQKVSVEELLAGQKTSMEELLQSQTASFEEQLSGQKTTIEEMMKASDDFNHRESVKVYRNVQAVIEEELPKQTAELVEAISNTASTVQVPKALLPIGIITMTATLASIGLTVAQLLGVL